MEREGEKEGEGSYNLLLWFSVLQFGEELVRVSTYSCTVLMFCLVELEETFTLTILILHIYLEKVSATTLNKKSLKLN